MDIQNLFANGSTSQLLLVSVDDLKEVCSHLYKEERMRQEKLKEQENDGLIDSKQLKDMLNVKDGALWKWNKRGYLCPIKIGSRNFYRREDVDRILGKRKKTGE
jgi:hypothetical protein